MPVLEKQKPLYKHDCNDCIYLGSDEMRDYYFCQERSVLAEGSLVIRLGNSPSDYFSMPVSVLIEARKTGEMDEDSVFVNCYSRYLKYINSN